MASDDLQELPGVGPATADKLKDAGFEDYASIAVASPGELSNKADIGDSTASDAINAAREEADVGGFESGTDVLERRREIGKLSMFNDAMDDLLGGGIETQSMTEFYGEFGSGKSQFTHQFCVNVQVPEEVGGLGGSAMFIDTEDSFRPGRIAGMVRGLPEDVLEATLERDGLDYTPKDIKDSETKTDGEPLEGTPAAELAEVFLDRIDVAKAFNSNHQMLLAEKALDRVKELQDTEFPMRLVNVDSLTSHFRAEYVGRGELATRQQKLNKHIHDLKRIADVGNCAIILANQVAANPDSYFGDPTGPIGGNILGHASTFRLYIRKSKGNKRVVKLDDAPNLPDGEAVVRITEGGLQPE